MRIPPAVNASQFTLLARKANHAPALDSTDFRILSRAERLSTQAAHFQRLDAQHPASASAQGLAQGRRFQDGFTKAVLAPAQATSAPSAPAEQTPQVTFGQVHLDAINARFATSMGDRDFAASLDFNEDGSIDFDDTNYVLSNWGKPVPAGSFSQGAIDPSEPFGKLHLDEVTRRFGAGGGDDRYLDQADANRDGVIDFADITHILANWGQTPDTGSENG